MRIGIISDNHRTVPTQLADLLSDCDAILHAGDMENDKIISELEHTFPNTPLYIVRGNCDTNDMFDDVPMTAAIELDGVAFGMAHYPEDARVALDNAIDGQISSLGDVVHVHGHTHIPKIITPRFDGDSFVVCPGALSNPRDDWQRTIAKIDIDNGSVLAISILSLSGKNLWDWSL